MFGIKSEPLTLGPLCTERAAHRPEKLFLLQSTEANISQFGQHSGGVVYIERLADDMRSKPAAVRNLFAGVPCEQAPGQDRDVFEHLHDAALKLMDGVALAYLVPARRAQDPYNYPKLDIPATQNGVVFCVFESAMHDAKFSGFDVTKFHWLRYPGQSAKALRGLVELLREADAKYRKDNAPAQPDSRPGTFLQRDPRAPEPAPLTV